MDPPEDQAGEPVGSNDCQTGGEEHVDIGPEHEERNHPKDLSAGLLPVIIQKALSQVDEKQAYEVRTPGQKRVRSSHRKDSSQDADPEIYAPLRQSLEKADGKNQNGQSADECLYS